MSSTLPTSVSELEPVSDYPGGSEWFSSAQTTAMLRTGPHTAALHASRWARSWCDACGRRRGADGRCAICDPWWTSPFYVYGSLLTVGVTALLMLVVPLLRPAALNARPTSAPPVAVLQTPVRAYGYSAPPMLTAPPTYRRMPPVVLPTFPRPVTALPPVAAANSDDAGMADIAKLRAMTDFAAGAETRRAAARAWAVAPPVTTAYLPRVNVATAAMPPSQAPVSAPMPAVAAPPAAVPAAPAASDPVDTAARSSDAAQTL